MELAFLYKVHQPFEGDDAKEERIQHSDEQSESELSAVGAFFHQRGIFNRVESLAFEPFYKIQQGGSTGMLMRKLNSPAYFRFTPWNSIALIVEPLRLMPGMQAMP